MEYTGSSYEGETTNSRMEGEGVFTFPNGTKYVGSMVDGQFHGEGTLHFPNGGTFTSVWRHGKATGTNRARGEYAFEDGLKFTEGEWEHCTDDDRRFYKELVEGLRPAGETFEVGKGKAKAIPEGTRDVGDGYLDEGKKAVFDYVTGERTRDAEEGEVEWALKFCRK